MDIRTGRQYGRLFKGRALLKLIDARGVVKNLLDGKCYLVIVRQDLFNQNLGETMLAEDQIEFFGVDVY